MPSATAPAPPDMTIGLVDEVMIRARVPDFHERTFYLSGPRAMVSATRDALPHLGVRRRRIKTDFFTGLA